VNKINKKQFVVNSNTKEIHNLRNENINCHLDEIDEKHIIKQFSSFAEVEKFLKENSEYDGCKYCMVKYHTK